MATPGPSKKHHRVVAREMMRTIEQLMKARWCRITAVEGKLHRDTYMRGLEWAPTGRNRITLTIEYTDTRRNPR